ncbi:hypothetical protein J6590_003516 [Homalodisca vitripennis]|nr:hypothetical protein J6590_003516 [Homalodisca vitripennis]
MDGEKQLKALQLQAVQNRSRWYRKGIIETGGVNDRHKGSSDEMATASSGCRFVPERVSETGQARLGSLETHPGRFSDHPVFSKVAHLFMAHSYCHLATLGFTPLPFNNSKKETACSPWSNNRAMTQPEKFNERFHGEFRFRRDKKERLVWKCRLRDIADAEVTAENVVMKAWASRPMTKNVI